jgi:hypothetical protein
MYVCRDPHAFSARQMRIVGMLSLSEDTDSHYETTSMYSGIAFLEQLTFTF